MLAEGLWWKSGGGGEKEEVSQSGSGGVAMARMPNIGGCAIDSYRREQSVDWSQGGTGVM